MSLPLIALLLTAAVQPRVVANAESYVFVPRLDKLDGVSAWSTNAGRYTVMAKSVVWSDELFPLFGIDITSQPSLAAAGIDATGPLTVSMLPSGRAACVSLKDRRAFVERGQSALSGVGRKWTGQVADVDAFGGAVTEGGVLLGGFVQRGDQGCVVKIASAKAAHLLDDAARALGSTKGPSTYKAASRLPGAAWTVGEDISAAVHATPAVMTVELRSTRQAGPVLQKAGPMPYATLPSGGVLNLKAQLTRESAQSWARAFARQLAQFGGVKLDDASSSKLAEHVTGAVFLRVQSLLMSGPLKTDLGRYFAIRHCYLAEVDDAEAVKAALLSLVGGAVRRSGQGIALITPQGDVDLGVFQSTLYVANDADARQTTLALLMKGGAGRLSHGLELTADPKLVGRALRQVSMWDVLESKELAGVFAAGAEVGPLLLGSSQVSGWADSEKIGHRAQLNWTLDAQPR